MPLYPPVAIRKGTGVFCKIIRTINANNIFDSTYVTRYDWAHINAFEYIPGEDAIIASYRNIHTIAKIDLNTQEIIWLLANPDFYAAGRTILHQGQEPGLWLPVLYLYKNLDWQAAI